MAFGEVLQFLDLFLSFLRQLVRLAYLGSLLPSSVNDLCLSQNTSESLFNSGTVTCYFQCSEYLVSYLSFEVISSGT